LISCNLVVMARVIFVGLFFCFATSLASPLQSGWQEGREGQEDASSEIEIEPWGVSTNADDFVDELLARARPLIQEKLEPVKLPEYSYEISKSVIITDVKAMAKVYDGRLSGLSTLYRGGDATLTSSVHGQIISISTLLGLSNLVGHYRGAVKFMSMGPSVTVDLTVRSVTLEVTIYQGISPDGTKTKPQLTRFDIKNLGKIDFEFDGLGPLDWIINPFSNFLINQLRGVIAWIVESPLHNIIADLLPTIKMPSS